MNSNVQRWGLTRTDQRCAYCDGRRILLPCLYTESLRGEEEKKAPPIESDENRKILDTLDDFYGFSSHSRLIRLQELFIYTFFFWNKLVKGISQQ
jgi:hypothetical protein